MRLSKDYSARRQIASLAAAMLLSGYLQPLVGYAHPQAANHEDGFSRPRRVDNNKKPDSDAVIIRIGLMTDVTSIALGSPSGFVVHGSAASASDSRAITSNQVRVEIRRTDQRRPDAASSPKPELDENIKPRNSKWRNSEAADRASYQLLRERAAQVAAFEAGKMILSSQDRLIITGQDEKARDSKGALKIQAPPFTRATVSDKPAGVRIGNKEYRGEIHLIVNQRGRINVINALPLEEYLRGVVPLELSPGLYPEIEALKAQAIAARTYALARRNQYRSEGFDLRDDTRSQIYGGLSAEQPLTNRAINETRGMVAYYYDEGGRGSPIEALYTANCGGRTENNEAVFSGKALPYLRSVECAPDKLSPDNHEIKSNRSAEQMAEAGGYLISRNIAWLDVLGFGMPRRVAGQYLRGVPELDEARGWVERAASLARRGSLDPPRSNITRLPFFASLIARAVYGDSRASLLLTQADIDYILAGLGSQDIPRELRADVAMMLREGILRLPADGQLGAQASITRGHAIQIIAAALSMKSLASKLGFETATAQPAEGGRLMVARAAKLNATGAPAHFELESNAWLFRRFSNESYPVDRLTLIGGERITYHVNARGRIDFLEAEPAERGASSDRFSGAAHWQERVSAEELKSRLARSRVNVGDIEDIVPIAYGASHRVLEMEVIGSRGRSRLRGYQVRSALGLKESLFVIERQRDEKGRLQTLVFTGRGWGHGVGLCQTGAFGLAREGYSYKAILQKYYTGVEVRKIY